MWQNSSQLKQGIEWEYVKCIQEEELKIAISAEGKNLESKRTPLWIGSCNGCLKLTTASSAFRFLDKSSAESLLRFLETKKLITGGYCVTEHVDCNGEIKNE